MNDGWTVLHVCCEAFLGHHVDTRVVVPSASAVFGEMCFFVMVCSVTDSTRLCIFVEFRGFVLAERLFSY